MRLLHKNQKGFTLIEVLITVAIVAGIGVVTTAAIGQLVQSNRTSNHMAAVRQVQQAGYWVNRDGVQAENINTSNVTGNGGFPLTLSWNWTDLVEGGELHTVVYDLTNPSGELYQLERNATAGTNSTTTIVGQYIYFDAESPSSTECSWNATEWVLTLNITAKVGLQTESRTYEIKPRPSA
jgi:prepilin-type N-terminal cleavage/methylation domain-containing protein